MRDQFSGRSGEASRRGHTEYSTVNIRCIRTVFYCMYSRYYIILNLLYSIVSRFKSSGKLHFSMDFGSEF